MMGFLIGYTIFVALCFALTNALARCGDYTGAALASLLFAPCILLLLADLVGWIAFLLNRVP